MARTIAGALPRFLLASSSVLVTAFAACSSSNQGPSSSGTGAGGSGPTASTGMTATTGDSSSTGIEVTTSGTGGGTDGGCGMTVMNECSIDAECDDGDPTTIDTCTGVDPSSEFPEGVCLHAGCDGGPSCSMDPIDTTCTQADAPIVFPPFVALTPPDVPAECANGFQLCDAAGAPNYEIHALPPGGSRALTLDLDFATYTAPDGLLITGVDGMCKRYVLFDSCRLKTADKPEMAYTNGMERPKDEAIRQFHLTLRPGTSSLTFDFSRVVSPMYVQVLGLCDFALPPVAGVGWFAPVP